MDDQFSAATATVQVLDVLANDVAAGGGMLTIASVSGTGQVVLEVQDGNRIRYQPACCGIATDQFTYTVRNAMGQMATATVRVDVQRRIALTLRAPALASIAQASVRIGSEAPLPAAISGNTATVTLNFRSDSAFVRADVAQSPRLALVSGLGSVPELVSRTPPSGRLDADAWAALEVSAFTTSLAGTVQSANGGALPTVSADWNARLAALSDWEGVTRRANYFASVLVAGESALPAGAALFDLAANPLRTELLLEQSTLAAGQRRALFPSSAARDPGVANSGTFWFYRGGSHVDELALRLDLALDGTGTLIGPRGAFAISWNESNGALNVGPGGPAGNAPTLLDTGLITRKGGACEFNVPQLFDRFDRVMARSLSFALLDYSAPSADVFPDSWIASVTGTKLRGFSLSTCQPMFEDADPGPSFPFKVRSGALMPVASLALTAGRWLLPYFGNVADGRPLGQALADVTASGNGVGPGAQAFTSQANSDGSLLLGYAGVGTARIFAVARFGDVFRVVVETQRVSGERQLDEAWLAKLDESVAFGAQLKNVRLRGCCRIGELRILRFDAQGSPFFELSSGGLAPADAKLSGARGTLSVSLLPTEDRRLVVDPIAKLGDGRFLTLSYRDGDPIGGAEAITLEPLTP